MERIEVPLTWDEIGMLKAGLTAHKDDLQQYRGGPWQERSAQLIDEATALFIRLSEFQARVGAQERHPAGKGLIQ